MHEARPFMMATKAAHRINDLIHLPQGHAVHLLVEPLEIRLDLLIGHGVDVAVGFVEEAQHRLVISQIQAIWSVAFNRSVAPSALARLATVLEN